MPLEQPQLGRVLDGHDPLGRRHVGGDGVQQCRLPGAGTAGDEDVQLPAHAVGQKLGRLLGERPQPDEVFERERIAGELADGERRSAERERRDDRVDAAAVRQARVDHRRRLVDPPPDLRDDAVDDPQQVGVVENDGPVSSIRPPLST